MANLYWKKNKKILSAVETPFKNEEELEKYLFDVRGILSDIFILNRQIRARAISGIEIPDMIGVDSEGNIVIIENKNVTVDEKIVSQVMNYALWAESNPDSIRSLWLETNPDFTEPDWDNLQIRIIIVAPKIKQHLAKFMTRIGYPTDLLEIKKFILNKEEFILINKIETEVTIQKPTHGQRVSDFSYYYKVYNKDSAKKFEHVVRRIENFIKKNKWELDKKLNQGYVGFKYGFPLVMGVYWIGSRSFGLFFKMPKLRMKKVNVTGLEFKGYEDRWSQVEYKINHVDFDLKKLTPLFLVSYKYIKGE